MNPVELYKRLPRKNCGECRQKTCMPFAFAVIKGEADIEECVLLSPNEREEIGASVKKFDWREDLIGNLKEDVKKISLSGVAPNLGAAFIDSKLGFRCFGRDVTVDHDGNIESSLPLTPWMRMLVLFYIRNGGCSGLSGKWVLHSELKGGLMKHKAFKRECEEPLKALLDSHFNAAVQRLDEIASSRPEEFATKNAWIINVFPRLPVVLLYWPSDSEFDSQVTIRFDSTADECFDVEQLIFLVEEVIKDIEDEIA